MAASSQWKIVYNGYEPREESLRESLCTLGNGYFGTRGAASETVASRIHYPGTYMGGVYNKLGTCVDGKVIYNEDFVNCPNWLFLTFKIGRGSWFKPSLKGILLYRQELDMRDGVLSRRIRYINSNGQKTLVETRRIVHIKDPHFGAIEYTITPENYSDQVTVRTMLDGSVINWGVERYRQLRSKHLKAHSQGSFSKNGMFLSVITSQSKIQISQACRTRIFSAKGELKPALRCFSEGKGKIVQELSFFAKKKQSYKTEKIVSIYTSNDNITNPVTAATLSLKRFPRFLELFQTHQKQWHTLWEKFDIIVDGDKFAQKVLRLHAFHLLQTASINTTKIDAGFPARGLHGEAYRGHIFWDELFAMPFFYLRIPEIAKELLLYRHRRISKARAYAKKSGYNGSMFPWQSCSTGTEETQVMHLNPMSGKWGPDYSCRQRHVSFAIAYNVWSFWHHTHDMDFLIKYGAEILLSIAMFGASLVSYDKNDGRYHSEGIMGPDEFHERLPGSPVPGLKDNAYSNVMIVWTLRRAQEVLDVLPDKHRKALLRKLKITPDELRCWKDITEKTNIIVDSKGIINQFDGYNKLKEIDLNKYRSIYNNISRMDRILKAEGKSPDEYKVAKQADVLMMFYLLSVPEVESIFHQLGYCFYSNSLQKNYEYHEKHTSHGSTLSKVVHCFIAILLDRKDEAEKWFLEVLRSDIHDTQEGTTPEGIHTGVMGGSINIVIKGFAGISMQDGVIRINPRLPKKWRSIKLKFLYRSQWFSLKVTRKQVIILCERSKGAKADILFNVQGWQHTVCPGKKTIIQLKK